MSKAINTSIRIGDGLELDYIWADKDSVDGSTVSAKFWSTNLDTNMSSIDLTLTIEQAQELRVALDLILEQWRELDEGNSCILDRANLFRGVTNA